MTMTSGTSTNTKAAQKDPSACSASFETIGDPPRVPTQPAMAQDVNHGDYGDSGSESDDDCAGDPTQDNLSSGWSRPEAWGIEACKHLQKMVAGAKGAASKTVVRFIKNNLRGAKLIIVVGQSGTGKTTLLSELTGQELDIGKSHRSGTKNHQVCPTTIDGEQYIFVDTAGFGAADMDSMENMDDIVSCLGTLGPFVTIAGVLFVYGGGQRRMLSCDLTTIQWVKCFCGPEFYQHITIVTSQWDRLSPDDFEDAWEESLPGLLEDPSVDEILHPAAVGSRRYHGGAIYHHSIKGGSNARVGELPQTLSAKRRRGERAEEARAMIRQRYGGVPGAQLQIVREMAGKTPWYETQAARVLDNDPRSIDLYIKDDFVRAFLQAKARPWARGGTAAPPGAPSASDTPTKAGTATAQQGAMPNGRTPPDHDSQEDQPQPAPKKKRPQNEKSFLEKALPWVDVAKDIAYFFWVGPKRGQHGNWEQGGDPGRGNAWQWKRGGHQGGSQGQSRSWYSVWGSLRDWWSGPPKTG